MFPDGKVDVAFCDKVNATHPGERAFSGPYGLCVDQEDNILLIDCQNHILRSIDKVTGRPTTLAGTGSRGDVDGDALKAQFSQPVCVCLDHKGRIFISDFDNSKIKMLENGQVTTVAGGGGSGYVDGEGKTSKFCNPVGICAVGNDLIIADYNNKAVRRMSLTDFTVSTICGEKNTDTRYKDVSSCKYSFPIGVAAFSCNVVICTDSNVMKRLHV
jgi:hypothetical protein